MSPVPNYSDAQAEADYQVAYRQVRPAMAAPKRRSQTKSRRRTSPKSFNGMHRRRAKRITW